MPTTDPTGRPDPRDLEEEKRNLEYFKGVGRSPLGWPAAAPNNSFTDPSEMERILNENPVSRRGRKNRIFNLNNVVVVVILLVLLIGAMLALR